MDTLIEFILEIIIGGATEGVTSKRVPKAVRLILFSIIIVISSSIMVLFIYFSLAIDSTVVIKITFLGAALIIGIFLVNLIKETIEKRIRTIRD